MLDRLAAGTASAIFPTVRNLERLARFASFAEAKADALAHPIETISPWVEEIDGEQMVVTRKGAISTRAGGLALIPGSMGTGSYIVRGLANPDSFYSASHGAGRRMSRGAAKRAFTAEDLAAQTEGVECRKDKGVVDEIPAAYKDLHSVITYQSDLVEPVAHLRTVLCVKG